MKRAMAIALAAMLSVMVFDVAYGAIGDKIVRYSASGVDYYADGTVVVDGEFSNIANFFFSRREDYINVRKHPKRDRTFLHRNYRARRRCRT